MQRAALLTFCLPQTARDAGETARAERDGHLTGRTPGRRPRERAGRPERRAAASPPGPGARPLGSRRGERPLAGRNGPGGKGARRGEGAVRPRCRYGRFRPAHNSSPSPHEKRAPRDPRLNDMEKGKGGAAEVVPRGAPAPGPKRVERRPPVSGALLSHGLAPQVRT